MKRLELFKVNAVLKSLLFLLSYEENNIKQISYESTINFYYINTNEIPGELSREKLISSHVKITCYLHM